MCPLLSTQWVFRHTCSSIYDPSTSTQPRPEHAARSGARSPYGDALRAWCSGWGIQGFLSRGLCLPNMETGSQFCPRPQESWHCLLVVNPAGSPSWAVQVPVHQSSVSDTNSMSQHWHRNSTAGSQHLLSSYCVGCSSKDLLYINLFNDHTLKPSGVVSPISWLWKLRQRNIPKITALVSSYQLVSSSFSLPWASVVAGLAW